MVDQRPSSTTALLAPPSANGHADSALAARVEQLELVMRDYDVQKAGHRADRAIAIERGNGRIRHHRPKSNRAAMAST